MKGLKQKLLVALRYSLYPAFYVLCLVAFFYATFPWERVKDRIIAEFDATQVKKGAEAQRLEIGSVTGYWFSGVAIENARLIIPPTAAEISAAELAARRDTEDDASADGDPGADAEDEEGDEDGAKKPDAAKAKKKAPTGPRDTILVLERVTARVELLPLLAGRIQVSFHAEAFGGEIAGSVPVKGKGDIQVSLENVDLGQIGILKSYVTVPVRGIATGELTLARGEGGKLSKSTGALDLVVDDAVIGDGKSKIASLITLPPAKLGKLEIAAEAEGGALKISKFGSAGADLELSAEGVIKIKDKWKSSGLDLFIRFKLADEYRSRDDKTKVIFGEAGSKIPGLIDSQPKIKRAKRGDDSYGIHVFGSLKAPKYEPWTTDDATVGASRKKDGGAAATEKDDDEPEEDATAESPFRRNRSRDRTTPPPRSTPPRAPSPPPPSREEPSERRREPEPEPPPLEVPAIEEAPPPEAPPDQVPLEEAPPGDAPPDPASEPPVEEVPAP